MVEKYDLLFPIHWSLAGHDKFLTLKNALKIPKKPSVVPKSFQLLRPLRKRPVITGIHAHHDWDGRNTTPERNVEPPQALINFLTEFQAINVVSKRLFNIFSKTIHGRLWYTPNGVDTQKFNLFSPIELRGKLRVGTSGTKKRDWKEGISEIIEPLAKLDFIDLKLAIPEDGHYVAPKKMPHFLNNIDVYALASASEGFPLKVLEACACARPVITTRVGGCEDLIINGKTGFFVDRDISSFGEKLQFFQENRDAAVAMGRRNRQIVEEFWSWEKRAGAWLDFIEANL